MKTLSYPILVFCLSVSSNNLVFAQGSLTPPAPPGPTMLTLDQIGSKIDAVAAKSETRVAITSLPYTITNPGSYYLTGNLTGVSGQNGITVKASNVTIDLNGFNLNGVSGSMFGIRASGDNLTIKNGSVTNWGLGGINAQEASNSLYSELRVSDNGTPGSGARGLAGDTTSVVRNCTAIHNSGVGIYGVGNVSDSSATLNRQDGFVLSPFGMASRCFSFVNTGYGFTTWRAALSDCYAGNNTAGGFSLQVSNASRCQAAGNDSAGFSLTGVCVLVDCLSSLNTGQAFASAGFGDGSLLERCDALANLGDGISLAADHVTVRNCAAHENGNGANGNGILVGNRGVLENNHADDNAASGLVFGGDCRVIGNHAEHNGAGNGPNVAGIHATGSNNRIEANSADENVLAGFQADANRNFIARNTARLNASNYVIAIGNRIAQIVVPATNANAIANANGGSTDGFTGLDPWANFSY